MSRHTNHIRHAEVSKEVSAKTKRSTKKDRRVNVFVSFTLNDEFKGNGFLQHTAVWHEWEVHDSHLAKRTNKI